MADPNDRYLVPDYLTTRLRFYNGQFLKDADFIDDQKYHLVQQRRHERLLHASGVVEGLVVTLVTGGGAVSISAGSAIDGQGRPIVLLAPQTLAVSTDGNWYVEAAFVEQPSTPADTNSAVVDNTRFTQSTTPASLVQTPTPGNVVLAQITVSKGTATLVTSDARTYAGVELPGLGGPFPLRAKGDTTPGWADLGAALNVRGDSRINGLLSVSNGVAVDAGKSISFADNGQIQSADATHRLLFRRTENILELREYGTIVLSAGATSGQQTSSLVVNPDGSATIAGWLRANRFAGENKLVLNDYATVNPSSNVYLHSSPGDRDSWIFRDAATTDNWGIYHRQIDTAVNGLPPNSIGFVGGGQSRLQAYISLQDGSASFAGPVNASSTLTVAGALNASGAINAAGTLTVTGALTAKSAVSATTTLVVGSGAAVQKLTIGDGGGLGFTGPNLNAADKQLFSPSDGLLRWQTNVAAGAHAFEITHQTNAAAVHLDISGPSWFTGGSLGVGTTQPVATLHVLGPTGGPAIVGGTGVPSTGYNVTGWTLTNALEARAANADKPPGVVFHHQGILTMGLVAQNNPRAVYITGPSNEPVPGLRVDGSISVATATAVAKLDIAGTARVGAHPTSVPGAYITGDFSDSAGGVEFRHTNGTQGIGFGYNTIYATGGNTDQDLNLKSRGAGNVKVYGRGTVTVCIEETLRIIRGTVNPPNVVGLGAGFTVTHVNTGVYDVNFNTPFNGIPAVVATQIYPAGDPNASQGYDTRDNAVIVGISNTKVRIKTGDASGANSDRCFAFIAVGP